MLRYTKWLELLHLFHKVQMYYQVKIDFKEMEDVL